MHEQNNTPNSILQLPENIRSEFSIDNDGKTFATQSAVARLCGITQPSLNELLGKIAIDKSLSKPLKAIAGKDYRAIGKISDIAIAAIVTHYAMYARKTTEKAREVLLVFQAIGIRSWIQQELGWKPPEISNFQEDLMLADYAYKSMLNAGIKPEVAEQINLDSLAKIYPNRSNLLQSAKKAIAASNPLPEAPMTPTEIGQELAIKMGLVSISARKINPPVSPLLGGI